MTLAPRLTNEDFLETALDLLPRGRAWPRDPDATLTRFWQAATESFGALHNRSLDLLEIEADPQETSAALFDWERAFGLPDECAVPPLTAATRRAALLARIAALGGQSRAYYIAWAKALGFDITITEFRTFRAGEGAAGDAVNGDAWMFTWRINAPETTISYFRAGSGSAGEPLAIWGNEVLACEMRRLAPAHTNLIIGFPAANEAPAEDVDAVTDRFGRPLQDRYGNTLYFRTPIIVTPPGDTDPGTDPGTDPPVVVIPPGALTDRFGAAIQDRYGNFLYLRTASDPIVVVPPVDPVDPVDPEDPIDPPPVPTGPYLKLASTHGRVIIESQDGVNAAVRLVRPIYMQDGILSVTHENTSLGNTNTFYTYRGPQNLLTIQNGNPALTRDLLSTDDGIFTTQILQTMSDGTFLELKVTFSVAPTRTGVVPAPSPVPPKDSVVFFENFDPDTGTGALTHSFGNVQNTGRGTVLLTGLGAAQTQPHPDKLNTNEYGFPNGRYEFRVRFFGDKGNSAGPAIILWPASDVWPGPEVDMGEFFADGRQYAALHWKDPTRPAEGNQQNRDSLWPFPAGFDPTVFNTLAADLLSDKVIFYINGVEFARDTVNPAPKDWAHGGENHTIGLQSGSDQSTDGSPSGLECDWIRFTPEKLIGGSTPVPDTTPPDPAPDLVLLADDRLPILDDSGNPIRI